MSKPLRLATETIRVLVSSDLDQVHGADAAAKPFKKSTDMPTKTWNPSQMYQGLAPISALRELKGQDGLDSIRKPLWDYREE